MLVAKISSVATFTSHVEENGSDKRHHLAIDLGLLKTFLQLPVYSFISHGPYSAGSMRPTTLILLSMRMHIYGFNPYSTSSFLRLWSESVVIVLDILINSVVKLQMWQNSKGHDCGG